MQSYSWQKLTRVFECKQHYVYHENLLGGVTKQCKQRVKNCETLITALLTQNDFLEQLW